MMLSKKQFIKYLSALSLACCLTSIPALAKVIDSSLITTEITSPPEVTIMQGEPITLTYRLTNSSNSNIRIPKSEKATWCTLKILRGSNLLSSWLPQEQTRGSFVATQADELKPRESYKSEFSTNSELTQLPPGSYRLILEVLPNPTGDTYPTSQNPIFKQQSYEMSLTIKPLDANIMKSRANQLYGQILRQQDERKIARLMTELAKLPGTQVSGTWRTMLRSKQVDRYRWAEILSTTLTKEAADTLITLQYTEPIKDESGQIVSVVGLLLEMAVESDNELRKYINGEIIRRRNSALAGVSTTD